MMNTFYRIAAVVGGIFAGGLTVAVIEGISSWMHPMPVGLTLDNTEGMKEWVATLPASAFLTLLVADAGGTIWDTVFTVDQVNESVVMDMQMDALPHSIVAAVLTPMILRMINQAVGSDMDAVKAYCEMSSAPTIVHLETPEG